MPATTAKDLWMEYHRVCLATKETGRYALAEPLAWRHLQQELRKLKGVKRGQEQDAAGVKLP